MRQFVMVWLVAAIALAGMWQTARAAPGSSGANTAPALAFGSVAGTTESAAQTLARRVLESADHRQLPFAVVDKQAATISIYNADGSLAGISTVLLGRTPGDEAVPGVGERAQNGTLRLEDLTTPAGRFASLPGRNRAGDSIVWLDYENALAIHRLRPAPARQQREQRMASADPRDKRISAGCVVVPVEFFDKVVEPVLGRMRAVVYIMPEVSGRWTALWPGLVPATQAAAAKPAAATQAPLAVPVLLQLPVAQAAGSDL